MPFLSYATVDEALENAGRFLQEGGAQAVKVEGGVAHRRASSKHWSGPASRSWATSAGRRRPQHGMGGKVRVQGKTRDQARALLADALAVQEAGAFSIVLELVPAQLAAAITERLHIPTIGIGAGPGCSGQVQVFTDLLGLGDFRRGTRDRTRTCGGRSREAARGLCRGRRRRHVPGRRRDGPHGRRGARRGRSAAAPPTRRPGPCRSAGIPLDRDL